MADSVFVFCLPCGFGPFRFDFAFVCDQIAEGLNELHHQQPPVVHRDMKPSNVLLDKNLDVKLCDFGFSHSVNASSLAAGSNSESSMRVGNKAGTPLYKAPETWDPDLQIDIASDIYSLGVVLHELWCGRLPWADKTYEQLVALHLIKKAAPPIDPAITSQHPKIGQIIEMCTRPDRKQRPKAEQLLQQLQHILPSQYGLDID
jgi:serine/threonine protein kinase